MAPAAGMTAGAGWVHFERERCMAKQFLSGFLMTLLFAAVVSVGLGVIFTLVNSITGPVGG